MLPTVTVRGVAFDLTLVLLLAYVLVLWMGGWVLEFLARATSIVLNDMLIPVSHTTSRSTGYECPQGEQLTLQTFDDRNKLAIYKAPASSCNECVLKTFCTPHDEGRHVYRTLIEFHESDVGRFHRWLSLLILAIALAFSVGGLFAWWNKPGEWLLVVATGLSLIMLWLDVRDAPEKPRTDGIRPEDPASATGW